MARHTLWLLRHAKTLTEPPEGGTDFDRTLAPRGRRDANALGALLAPDGKRLGLGKVTMPQVALVSPAARTTATAEVVVAGWATPPEVRLVPALYTASPEEVLDELRRLADDVVSVMVVGHNPTAESLSTGLIAKKDKKGHDLATRRGFPTCALGIYEFAAGAWSDMEAHSGHLRSLLIPPFEAS
jgi:phosphohistidine phosphatase